MKWSRISLSNYIPSLRGKTHYRWSFWISVLPSYKYYHPPIKMQLSTWGLFPFLPFNVKSQVLNVKLKWSQTGLSRSDFRKMDGPERSLHAKTSCDLKNSFFSGISGAFDLVRMLSANQIAEKLQYVPSEEDKQNDKRVRQYKDGKMQKTQNTSVPLHTYNFSSSRVNHCTNRTFIWFSRLRFIAWSFMLF